jgi:hypothetical protein
VRRLSTHARDRLVRSGRRGEVEGSGIQGKVAFVAYAKPFKWLSKVTMPDGEVRVHGFDGEVSWSTSPADPEIDDSIFELPAPVKALLR